MSLTHFFLSLFLCVFSPLIVFSKPTHDSTSPYFSRSILFRNYKRMLQSFKIYIYSPPSEISYTTPEESLFFTSLQRSRFLTQSPEEAHLFFVPFPSDSSTRSVARVIRDLRNTFPYWNRTLGADHFYLSSHGLGYNKDRNLVELKKNSIQISLFPSQKFVPHKDITLPPFTHIHSPPSNRTSKHSFFVKHGAVKELTELRNDVDFLIESEPSDEITLVERFISSEFCLFEYGAEVSSVGDALKLGCVPVIVTNRPIQDMPLMDVLRWQELTVFVGSNGGVKEIKRVVKSTCGDERCERMRRMGGWVGQHFVWNNEPEPYDSFNMVMYQLWVRRHTIRYGRIDSVEEASGRPSD